LTFSVSVSVSVSVPFLTSLGIEDHTGATQVKTVLLALCALALMIPVPAQADAAAPDVLFIHGVLNSTACPGVRTAVQAAPLAKVLAAAGYTGSVKGVDFECGDSTGLDIKPYGTLTKSQYNANARIEDVAYALARFIQAEYTDKGRTVNIVGHSMGGLIAGYAVKRYGAQVARIVTISTPYGGFDEIPAGFTATSYTTSPAVCGSYVQCKEMITGSPFLKELASFPMPATTITTIGGSPKDCFSFASTSATAAQHKIDYYATAPVNYGHSAYLTDTSMKLDVPLRIDGVALTGRTHSLLMAATALQAPS